MDSYAVINQMGPLELVLNTPSHHRVHHGINAEYLDKNFGAVFIVWYCLLKLSKKKMLLFTTG